MSVDFFGPALNVEELIASGARGFIGKAGTGTGGTVAAVTDVTSVLDQDTLLPKPGWQDIGSAREGQGSNYDLSVSTQELKVEQSTAVVFENITETNRSITQQWAEFTPDKLAILEQGTAVTASGLWHVEGKAITARDAYRVAIIGLREQGNGRDITDTTGAKRGELIGVVLQFAKLSADSKQFELQRGQLANMPVTFKGYPDPVTSVVSVWVGETGPLTLT